MAESLVTVKKGSRGSVFHFSTKYPNILITAGGLINSNATSAKIKTELFIDTGGGPKSEKKWKEKVVPYPDAGIPLGDMFGSYLYSSDEDGSLTVQSFIDTGNGYEEVFFDTGDESQIEALYTLALTATTADGAASAVLSLQVAVRQ